MHKESTMTLIEKLNRLNEMLNTEYSHNIMSRAESKEWDRLMAGIEAEGFHPVRIYTDKEYGDYSGEYMVDLYVLRSH